MRASPAAGCRVSGFTSALEMTTLWKIRSFKEKKTNRGERKVGNEKKKHRHEEPSAGSHYMENSAGLHIPMYPSVLSWARFSSNGVGGGWGGDVHTSMCTQEPVTLGTQSLRLLI